MEVRKRTAKQEKHPHHHFSASDVVHETAEVTREVVEKVAEKLTCMWDELQEWQRDNQFIRSGYRPATASYLKSLKSLSYWHNETVNIYSHLLGAVFFGVLSSILYATLSPRHEAAKLWNVLDYVGIVGLITGSFIPSVYYGFKCETLIRDGYWIMICTIAVSCATVSVHPHFRTPKYRPVRTSMFVAMGLSGVLPIVHGIQLHGIEEVERRSAMSWLLAEGAAYLVGALLYAARVPERLMPGKFDIVGSSHQIFHILVLVGAGCHLKGMVVSFDNAHSNGVQCP
ncbi:hypothetical protein TWF173_009505 [Orbilia oligospora]|nr:hypothetical protein TWF173_009505 [Orbilia oligospora]